MSSEFTQQKNKKSFFLKRLGLLDYFGICSLREKKKHNRDINAALNILHKWNETSQSIVGEGTAEIKNACGVPNGTMKQETSQPSIVFLQ